MPLPSARAPWASAVPWVADGTSACPNEGTSCLACVGSIQDHPEPASPLRSASSPPIWQALSIVTVPWPARCPALSASAGRRQYARHWSGPGLPFAPRQRPLLSERLLRGCGQRNSGPLRSSGQFSCLNAVWTRESGWNPYATNPLSGAYGIPQSLPAAKMASAGPDWQTNPATQIR